MSNQDLFSKRLKLLRITYGLSMKTLADVWGYKNTGTISQFENNKSSPSFNRLIQVANFYAVALDWLVGRSNIIYTKESVFEGEIALNEQFVNLGEKIGFNYIAALHKGGEFIVPTYLDKEKREKYYSFDVRANIVVLHNQIFRKDYKIVEYLPAKEKEKTEILSSLICLDTQIIDGKEVKIKRTVPVYDVAAAYRKLQQETDDADE